MSHFTSWLLPLTCVGGDPQHCDVIKIRLVTITDTRPFIENWSGAADVTWLTHAVEVIKHLMHANYLIIKLIVTAGGGQKRVSISDEHVKEVHNLRTRRNQSSKVTNWKCKWAPSVFVRKDPTNCCSRVVLFYLEGQLEDIVLCQKAGLIRQQELQKVNESWRNTIKSHLIRWISSRKNHHSLDLWPYATVSVE